MKSNPKKAATGLVAAFLGLQTQSDTDLVAENIRAIAGVVSVGAALALISNALKGFWPTWVVILIFSLLMLPGAALRVYRNWQKPKITKKEYRALKTEAESALHQRIVDFDQTVKETLEALMEREQQVEAKAALVDEKFQELKPLHAQYQVEKADAEAALQAVRSGVVRATTLMHEHFEQLTEMNEALHSLLAMLNKKVSDKAFTKAVKRHGQSSAESVRNANRRLFKRLRVVEAELKKVAENYGGDFELWKPSIEPEKPTRKGKNS